jgi:hypothetical protein
LISGTNVPTATPPEIVAIRLPLRMFEGRHG